MCSVVRGLPGTCMKYLFGPVNSRRLGLSLGIDIIPNKICSYNCIYCEVGPNTDQTCERREYVPVMDVLAEIDLLLTDKEAVDRLDVFTITASGEPTLHSGIGNIIRHIREKSGKPVAVLTNGSLLHIDEVRQDLMAADIVVPSLDSARDESFRKINRPAACVALEDIIKGMKDFNREFKGNLWLEILLAKGINDSAEDIKALVEATHSIQPERIQLNTVVRPPLESFAVPLARDELEHIAGYFHGNVEIIADFTTKKQKHFRYANPNDILDMIQRRPCTADDIAQALNLDPSHVAATLKELTKSGRLTVTGHDGKFFYQKENNDRKQN